MARPVVLITPTHRVGSEGYYEANIQMATATEKGYEKIGKPWHSDSVHFHGELDIDFENNGNIVVWNTYDELFVRDAYTTNIYGGKEAIEKYYKR